MTEFQKIRSEFPLLSRKINGKFPVYLDSAATTLKPWPVIEKISHFYSFETANVHRGAHFLASQATEQFEAAREKVRGFIGAGSIEEVIFTKGTTESINLAAHVVADVLLKAGDEILLSELEHHSNIVPWQLVAERVGATIRAIPVDKSGEIDLKQALEMIGPRTKVLAITHCSNALGTLPPVKALIERVHSVGGVAAIDGAQWVSGWPTDVTSLNADFYSFSAHKLFGPFGMGVLFAKKQWLEKARPYQGGGSMIHEVRFEGTTYHDLPFKFEAGTPNIGGVLGLAKAIEYVGKMNWTAVHEHEMALLKLAREKLSTLPGMQLYGSSQGAPILSFNIEGAHASDVGHLLSQQLVAVRAGHHCTQPLMRKLGVPATVRASFSIYNNESDVNALFEATKKAGEMLL